MRHLTGVLALLCTLFGLPAGLITTRQVWLDLAFDLDLAAVVAQPLGPPVLVLTTVAAVVLLWAWLVVATTADVAAVLMQGARAARLLPAPLQTTVTTLAGSLLLAFTTVTASVSAAGAASAAATAAHTAGPPTAALPAAAGASSGRPSVTALPTFTRTSADTVAPSLRQTTAAGATVRHGVRQPMTVTVRRGDTLWSIAERCLGDPHRWQEIYRLNAGRYDRTGRMGGGNHIEPSWILILPGDARDRSAGTDPGGGSAGAPPSGQAQPSNPAATTTSTGQPSDDGVTGQDPTAIPRVPTVTVTASPAGSGPGHGYQSAEAGESGTARPTERAARSGIGLFSGSWVDAGLATAVLAAVALVWAHRRRRYVPRASASRSDDTEPTAMPAVIRTLRQRAGASRAAAATTMAGNGRSISIPAPDDTDVVGLLPPADAVEPERADGAETRRPTSADPHATAVDRWPTAALGLVGPGAEAAARGLLVTAASDGLDDQAARTVVLIPAPVARRLFGIEPGLPDTPRIVITPGLADALTHLEAVVLHRSRVLQEHSLPSVAEVRRVDPLEEPMPPTILLTDTDTDTGPDNDAGSTETGTGGFAEHRGRVAALLRQGRHLDVHGVLLGDWPDGDTIAVGTDGTTRPAGHTDAQPGAADHLQTRHTTDIARLTVLTAGEALDLLAVLAESHTGECPTFSPTQPAQVPRGDQMPAPPDGAAGPGQNLTPGTDTTADIDAVSASTAATAATPNVADSPQASPTPGAVAAPPDEAATHGPAAAVSGTTAPAEPSAEPSRLERRVLVRLLGPPTVVNADTSRGTLRAKSLELLTYLAVHDGAAHYESILDDLLPDAPASKAVHRLHTYVSDLRQVLRRTGGAGTYLTRDGQRYLLNREAFDIDLWRMRQAARETALADTPDGRITLCQQVVQAYRGHLADGVDYEWIEPHREAARRQAIDATLTLADALADEPGTVIRILDAAISHSPYTEALYQAAMRANAAIGRLDTVRALRHTLAQRLADLDTEPSEETATLADRLLTSTPTGRRHRPRRTDPGRPTAAAAVPPVDQPVPRTTPAAHVPDQATTAPPDRSAGTEAAA
ncbi:BTAD domain-containing putative transcriptional regulator [Dactylosporangium sp. NPDC049525]|uniref:BTAD domain-containing putative transcriptional regulator n=1 Tax=Dactylosporangium sp. NPDC049525 TaxID=3154730 RepID=UPI003414C7AF